MKAEPPERRLASSPNWLFGTVIWVVAIFILMPVLAFGEASPTGGLPTHTPSYAWLTAMLILVSIVINALFVSGDTALEIIQKAHLRNYEKDSKESKRLTDLYEHRVRYIATCTLGSQTMRAWMMILSFVPALSMSQHYGASLGIPNSWGSVLLFGTLVTIPVAALNMVFGELVPRSLASVRPAQVLLRSYPLIRSFALVFSIPNEILTFFANLLAKRFGGRASFALPRAAEEEIKILAETAIESGEIQEEERAMLNSVFEFSDTIVREIMTPRVDLDAAPIDTEPLELMKMIQESGHTRIPLFESTDDQIIGIIHAKDLLRIDPEKPINLRTLLRPVLFVPESKALPDLLREMRQHRTQMAIIQDEFGGTAGIATIEDIVEELVGEIVDEYDQDEPMVQTIDGGWIVDGRMNLFDLMQETEIEIESEEFDTVGGYVFGLMGRQPKPGDSIANDDYRFVVEQVDGRRIIRLCILRLESDGSVLSDLLE